MTDPHQNERLAKLEVIVEHMARSNEELAQEMKALAQQVAALNEILAQAKGIRWMLGGLLALAGFMVGKFAGFLTFSGK